MRDYKSLCAHLWFVLLW